MITMPHTFGSIYQISKEACQIAALNGDEVKFTFNGITCHAYPQSFSDDIAEIALLKQRVKQLTRGY